jgi:hypothetical protein
VDAALEQWRREVGIPRSRSSSCRRSLVSSAAAVTVTFQVLDQQGLWDDADGLF